MPQPAHLAASMTGLRPLIAGQPSRPQAPQRRQRLGSVSYVRPAPPRRSSAHSPRTITARAPELSALSAASMPFTSLASSSTGSRPQRRQSSAGSPPPFFSSTMTSVPPVPASRRRAPSVSSAAPRDGGGVAHGLGQRGGEAREGRGGGAPAPGGVQRQKRPLSAEQRAAAVAYRAQPELGRGVIHAPVRAAGAHLLPRALLDKALGLLVVPPRLRRIGLGGVVRVRGEGD